MQKLGIQLLEVKDEVDGSATVVMGYGLRICGMVLSPTRPGGILTG
jgi:hypothetical protein